MAVVPLAICKIEDMYISVYQKYAIMEYNLYGRILKQHMVTVGNFFVLRGSKMSLTCKVRPPVVSIP